MPENWMNTPLGSQVTLQRGFDTSPRERRPGDVPIIASGGFFGTIDRAAANGPGVVIGRKGRLGTAFYIASDYWPHSTTLWVKDFHGNDPRFVYYFFRDFPVLHLDVGTANPTLNRNHVHTILVDWPPLPDQKEIAAVLGAIDDKIAANRRTARTLADIAESMFANLMRQPSRLVPLVDVSEINRRSVDKRSATTEIEYVDISAVSNGELLQTKTFAPKDAPGRARRLVSHGDTIWSMVRPNRRSFWRVADPPANLIVSTGFAVLTPRGVPSSFLYLSVTTREFVEYLTSLADGSAYPALRPEAFENAPIRLPGVTDIGRFDATAGPVLDEFAMLARENRTLEHLRDALLPDLISGRVRVRRDASAGGRST